MATNFRWPPFNRRRQPDEEQAQQPAQPAEPDLPPPWGNRTRIRVTGTARLDEPVLQIETAENMGGRLGQDTTRFLIICASCRRVLHTPEEIGGICSVCEQSLCAECAKRLCALCGECVCRKECHHSSAGEIGKNHGILRGMAFVIAGGLHGKKI